METNVNSPESSQQVIITPDLLLEHWQAHRRLTRRVIEAFPENDLYNFSIGGMRSFAQLTMEMIVLSAPGINGIVSGNWTSEKFPFDFSTPPPATKNEILTLWDSVTDEINTLWPQIPVGRFQENDLAFGMYEGTIQYMLFYVIDNEIHHRGQGYVYLRALGIEPPAFWDRS
ncbi:DinB family protein [Dyadobacter sp. CY345]|uniref:DinB family protein n=1 Tax=Dyadobacter sp. CY345 TaxID=2909335 RepID=UPI001F344BBF|nr:DinB family protein [Dyadobacter sp. CY345]MCF2447433.1 DinB family protein [Dyadobacter sp. CY345]